MKTITMSVAVPDNAGDVPMLVVVYTSPHGTEAVVRYFPKRAVYEPGKIATPDRCARNALDALLKVYPNAGGPPRAGN